MTGGNRPWTADCTHTPSGFVRLHLIVAGKHRSIRQGGADANGQQARTREESHARRARR